MSVLSQKTRPLCNAPGLDSSGRARQELINGLNEDLAGEYQAIAAYATLVAFFRAEVADRQRNAQFLSETVITLGGAPVEAPKYMALTCDPYELLEQFQRSEPQMVADYRQRMARAARHDDADP